MPGHQTEIRSRWTSRYLYLLFVRRYRQLNLKPDRTTTAETNRLWEWDVTEAFIGSDLQNIAKYKEFEISPQGEWVDLDIDRGHPDSQGGLDQDKKIWYGEMRIPFDQISAVAPHEGSELRANFYRIQGPPERSARALLAPDLQGE